jgi:ABC-type uncharacterized transport system substrate-binding protein
VKRREFITLLGGTVATWPPVARAQQPDRMRRVSLLMTLGADEPIAKARVAAFVERLYELGWREGENLRLDIRWNVQDPEHLRVDVANLVALAPDVVLATGSITVGPLVQATRTLPIVFVIVPDPVGAGFVESLARPGGNATGFLQFEFSLSGKWLELLKEIAPDTTRVAVLRDPSLTAGVAQFAAIQIVAPAVRVELIPLNVGNAAGIERAIASFAQTANSGLIVTSSPVTAVHRDLIIKLAAQYQLPTVYYERFLATAGGLISYGPDFVEQYRRGADYVDRILRGEKPADLPVQTPTKYEMVINLKTAQALGLTVPPALLVRADEVIE